MPRLAPLHRDARFCPILDVVAQVRQLQARGVELIDLSVGTPNFLPAPHVYAQAQAALAADRGVYGSSRGHGALVEAYLHHLAEQGLRLHEERHIVTGLGAKHLLHSVFAAILEPGDEVVIPTPCWPTYFDIVQQAGGTVVPVPGGVDADYKISPDALAAALGPRTKAVLLNNPSNPTGAAYDRDALHALAAVLRGSDAWIVSDDVYSRFVSRTMDFCHLLQVAPDLIDRVVKIDSVSKLYGMPGWRVGMMAAPVSLAEAVVRLNSNSISSVPEVAAAAAAAALAGDQSFSYAMVERYRQRRELAHGLLASSPRIRCPLPDGAFYLFPDVSACFGLRLPAGTSFDPDSHAPAERHADLATARPADADAGRIRDDLHLTQLLLTHAQVAVVPGRFFGEPRSIRITCSADLDTLADGVERIRSLVDALV
ncbi:aminotransferase class I/II-fold pyridoxal phosphate-dependent enzyme [Roseateles amylovorans]|uniref:Aminotransferase n=1 Tax=Roseateles amylovorans TaxID=2978473 RepID=A0ABY6B729_9BURK|nr:aminotransferase class I/II-fold pyridoxal phosphate-dependent enzyme [Roseateles amylovorans]UXH80981.1 aminotransferase class I/II-fold pyridoxal phosphate-dependent enzyme [Roseateles amylovorans]